MIRNSTRNIRAQSVILNQQGPLGGDGMLVRKKTVHLRPSNRIRSLPGSSHESISLTWPPHIFTRDYNVHILIHRNQRWQSTSRRRFLSSSTTPSERLFHEELNILYDSKCNVCKLEMDFLARRDASRALSSSQPCKLKLTDLEDESYDPNHPANGGVTYSEGMASIHAVTHDGQIVEGVAVFPAAYDLVGLGWLFRFTEWPATQPIVRWGYDMFAKYRTNVTRGSSLESLIQAYEARKASKQPAADCDNGRCSVAEKS